MKKPRELVSGPERGQYPWDMISLDHAKMKKFGKMEYLLVVNCDFSGYLQTFPVPTQKQKYVVKALKECFAALGVPKRIKSDGSKSLLAGEEVRKYLSQVGVKKLQFCIPHEKFHNSRCERSIQSFRHAYRSLSTQLRTRDWPDIAKLCTMAYNVAPTLRTGLSPHQIFFNRNPHIFIPNAPQMMSREKATNIYYSNKSVVEKINRAVMSADAKQRQKYLAKVNSKAKKRKDIEIGTMVLLRDLSTPKAGEEAKKHKPAYLRDPFEIINKHQKMIILRRIKDGK